jgi:hypothetical protein
MRRQTLVALAILVFALVVAVWMYVALRSVD